MTNKAGNTYKLRVLWDECNAVKPKRVELDNRPHVEAFLNSTLGNKIVTHAQNSIWTVERWINRATAWRGPKDQRAVLRWQHAEEASTVQHGPRILLDITNTIRTNFNTGIQRVCRRVCEEGARDRSMIPVALEKGYLHRVQPDWVLGERIGDFRRDDIYVVFDTFWEPLAEYKAIVDQARRQGALVATCVYDAIPAIDPEICQVGFGQRFNEAFGELMPRTDIALCISQATLDDVEIACRGLGLAMPPTSCLFHLGADLTTETTETAPLPEALVGQKFFLSVGTVEPKKAYCLTLDAFDRLWGEGREVKLVIVGRYGWGAQAIKSRINAHPRLDKDLFWFEGASDAMLRTLYASAYCFVQASVAEGFGIPLIEAGLHRLPIVASDIAVFKEVAANADLAYFESENADALYEAVLTALLERPIPTAWRVPTWRDSMVMLRDGLWDAAADLRADVRTATEHLRASALRPRAPRSERRLTWREETGTLDEARPHGANR